MIGLDANILVRYVTQDDPAQSAKATQILERHLTAGNPGWLSVVALAETVWVLDRSYHKTGHEIAVFVERLLQTDTLVVENEAEVFSAMAALRDGRGSFADALIAALGVRAGCKYTLTFDRRALRIPGFELA